jgi:hypothetical protein
MTAIACTYSGNRDETLIAYLYEDIDSAERVAFDAHLVTCTRCRLDLEALRGVRRQLARWSPPEPNFVVRHPQSSIRTPVRSLWRAVPVWAQVAAALLFLGVSAGIANIDARYDGNGLTVRTGWSKPAATPALAPAARAAEARGSTAPWRADLTALEQQLRSELGASQAALPSVRSTAASEAEVLRRARAMVEESERRQQRELALRVAEVLRDVNAQRRADLVKIDRNLGLIQNNTGVEVLRQREMLNTILTRVSQRQ